MIARRWKVMFVCCCCIPMSYVMLYGMITHLVLHPQDPAFRIDSAALSQLDVSTAGELIATLDLTVHIINPNVKLGIDLYSVEAMLFYLMMHDRRERLLLAAKPVTRPFCMTTGNQTTVSFKLSTTDNTFVQDKVANTISEAKAGRGGSVSFQIRMLAWWNHRTTWLQRQGNFRFSKVLCGVLEFGFDDHGTSTVSSSRACENERVLFSNY